MTKFKVKLKNVEINISIYNNHQKIYCINIK